MSPDPRELGRRLRERDRSAAPAALNVIEDRSAGARERKAALLREVSPTALGHEAPAHLIGVTGPPGAGKSTLLSALVASWRRAGDTLAVLAVDPSSKRSGGSLLGDRARIEHDPRDDGLLIRSTAAGARMGGLAAATREAAHALAAAFDLVVVETVGVGQSEVDIAGLADTTLVLLAPGMGDGIQAAKAGILEIGDVYVVNKADREGADQVVRDLRSVLSLGARTGAWRAPIVKTVAHSGEGVDDLVAAVDRHREMLEKTGGLTARRERRARDEIEAIAVTSLRARFADLHGHADLDVLAAAVVAGDHDPYTAADRLVEAL